ncbi:MAG: JAB domain-containing protein [Hyphomicrobiales bacterium]|nr:JAB domain-containing protein [Hyphomicrobiales bacterium]
MTIEKRTAKNKSAEPGGHFSEVVEKQKPHYHGHRDRLRAKFRSKGAESLAEYEILELLLFRSIPRRDTKPLAKQLLAEFGSLAEVLAAPTQRLSSIKGLGEAVITDLQLIHAAANTMNAEKIRDRTLLGSWSAVLDYCRTTMAFSDVEKFRILFLDKRNCLIADEVQQTGTVDHTPVYPREIAKRALELAATSILLVHNHPSGDPSPSKADTDMTRVIIDTLAPLNINVLDHIIIARDGHASLKGMQLI